MTKCRECGAVKQEGKFCEECGAAVLEQSSSGPKSIAPYKMSIVAAAIAGFLVLGFVFLLSPQPAVSESTNTVATISDVGPSSTETSTEEATADVEGARMLTADIQGMTCGGCVAGIERKVNALDGTISATVYLRETKGEFVYDPSKLDKQSILDTITTYGYSATEISDEALGETQAPAPTVPKSTGGSCGGGSGGCGCGG